MWVQVWHPIGSWSNNGCQCRIIFLEMPAISCRCSIHFPRFSMIFLWFSMIFHDFPSIFRMIFLGLFTDVFVAVVLVAHRSFGMPSAVLRVWMPSLGAGCGAGCCAGCCFLKIRTLILLDRTINININIYIYVYVIYIYILYYIICIYIYVYSCLFILSLFNHVMPAPHRSLFVTLGRVTLIKASAAALVLNFAGESPGGIARRAICPFRGLPKNNGFICIMMIYIDLYRCLWIYYGLSPIYWYYVAAWKFTNMENDDQSWDQWKPKLRKWNPQVHWQHWVTDRADCRVWCLGSEPKIILDRWIKHGRDKTMWCYMILPSGYD